MGRYKKVIRKMGNHTEDAMRTALELIRLYGFSLRQASTQCNLSYATVRRYVVLAKKNEGKPIRLTPNYEVNRVFSAEEEACLAKYVKQAAENFKGLTAEGFSSRDCRRLAYEMAIIIDKKIPKAWHNAKMAGLEWLRLFKERHDISLAKRKAGEIIRETVFDRDEMEAFFCHLKIEKTVNHLVVLPGGAGPSNISNTKFVSATNVPKDQDPLSRNTIDQCRFCGEFCKECVPVSNMHLSTNTTTIAFNEIVVQLDFSDRTLPHTVCKHCDAKLQEMFDFVKLVKNAQKSLISVGENVTEVEVENAREDVETVVVKTEYEEDSDEADSEESKEADSEESEKDEEDSKSGIVDSVSVGETIFIKENLGTQKRKMKELPKNPKKAKADNKSENETELIIDIKEEVIELDENDGDTGCKVSDTGTDVKPSETELATSALVYEMKGDGAGQGYS